MFVCGSVCTLWYLCSAVANSLLPAKSKVLAFQHLSIAEKVEEEVEEASLSNERKNLKYITTVMHVYAHKHTKLHQLTPGETPCISSNLFSQENSSTSSSTSQVELHLLLCTHCTECCFKSCEGLKKLSLVTIYNL